MARPAKTGLDYYPMDVGFLRDKKVRLLRSEFGASSVLFVLYVLGKVYEGDGYFLVWDKDEGLLAADELRESPAYISEVLRGCLSRSLFDERVFQVFGVLTSAGIQRRYLRGCEKRDEIILIHEYWLLDIDDKKDVPAGIRAKLAFKSLEGGNNPVNSPGNEVNSPENPQSKVKKSRVKERKVRGGAPAASANPPTKEIDIAELGFGKELEDALRDWLSYKREKHDAYQPTGLKNFIAQVLKQVELHGESAVAGLIRDCMSSNYRGITWDRLSKQAAHDAADSSDNAWEYV